MDDDNIAAGTEAADPPRPRLLVWQDEIVATPGYIARARMEYVKRIGYVFQGNVADYKALVARLQDPGVSLPIFATGNEGAHDLVLSEAERLLHNVLMALSTRIDQQRAFMNRNFSDDRELTAEYATRIRATFGSYPPADFIRDLRNYLTHHRLPVAQSSQSISTTTYTVTFILSRGPLLEWKKWKATAQAWLEAQTGDLAIVDLVDGYAKLAGDFDKWLYYRIQDRFAEEISAYDQEAQRFEQEWNRAFGLTG